MAKQFAISTIYKTGVTSYGVASEVSKKTSVETAVARNEDGKVTNEIAYSKKTSIDINGTLDGAAPSAGDTLTIDSVTYLIKSVEVKESNTAYSTFTLTAEKDDAATQVGYSA